MAIRNPARGTIPVTPPPKITLRQPAYALAVTLFNAGAAAAAIPIRKDMQEAPLSELVAKSVVKRSGATYGRYGTPGMVRILVAREQLVPAKSRTRLKPVASLPLDTPVGGSPALTIADLEAFVAAFRRAQAPLLKERSRAIGARIAELQAYLATATGDDFRNTMAMANAALRELDAVEHDVAVEVIVRLRPDPMSPLFPIWHAVAGTR